jgi:MFS family permease
MNKFERQSRQPAASQSLPAEIAAELPELTTEVLAISDAPPIAPRAPLTQREVRTILMSLLLTMFLAALDQTIVATALPTIGRQFHDVTNLSWVITAYLLASTAVAPVFGTLSDIYGRRAMIITALGLFIAGSIVCAVAPNMMVLILGRGLQGLGGGGIMPVVQTVIADVVTPRERGQYQAYFSGVWMAAGIGGPVLGGVFAEHLHWSMIFWINVPLGLISLGMLLANMGKIPVFHRRRKVDWLGGVLLMASAVVIMLVLTWGGNRYPWLSPTIMAMVGACAEPRICLACPCRQRALSAIVADGRTGRALRAGGRRLRVWRHAGADRASAAVLRGRLPSQRQPGRPRADSARRDLDRRRRDCGEDHGARQAL